MKRTLSIALLAAAVMLAGCPKKNTTVESPSQGSTVPGAQGEGAGAGGGTGTTPLEGGAAGAGGAAGQLGGPLAKHTVYFDFDKSEIKPEFADVITAHAKNLTSHPNLKMRLEGNTDERGTREYNIGLGERRAQAVRRALMLQGVAESQLTTVSYGAERPAAEGDDESAWAQNRRVDMVYLP
jgi:peptidoglycan-associated lipoprotein